MSQKASLLLLFFSSLAILSIARAQDRGPHGLNYENPVTFPPSAVDFFHPKTLDPETKDPCASSKCSPLPLPAQFKDTQASESKVSTSQKKGSRLSVGGIAGIVVGSAFVALVAVGASYVAITRRANVNQANSVQPNA